MDQNSWHITVFGFMTSVSTILLLFNNYTLLFLYNINILNDLVDTSKEKVILTLCQNTMNDKAATRPDCHNMSGDWGEIDRASSSQHTNTGALTQNVNPRLSLSSPCQPYNLDKLWTIQMICTSYFKFDIVRGIYRSIKMRHQASMNDLSLSKIILNMQPIFSVKILPFYQICFFKQVLYVKLTIKSFVVIILTKSVNTNLSPCPW